MARSPIACAATRQPARCAAMIVLGEPAGVSLQVAAVARLAVVGGGHGGGPADQRPVGEDLHRAEPQPVVAEAGAQSQVDARSRCRRTGARPSGWKASLTTISSTRTRSRPCSARR